jgi:hypothetical protein
VGNPIQLVGDYTNPILKPEAAGVVKKQGENELNGMGSATPLNQCWPGGVPFVLRDIGMQMLQQPDRIIMIYFQENGPPIRAHEPTSSRADHAILVRGFSRLLRKRHAGDRHRGSEGWAICYGGHVRHAHTEALHVVERYRLVDYESAKEALERNAKENFRVSDTTPATAIYGR